MRNLKKSWQDRRPGWTRRVCWYVGDSDIRLKFEDQFGIVNLIYDHESLAYADYRSFAEDTTDTRLLRTSEHRERMS